VIATIRCHPLRAKSSLQHLVVEHSLEITRDFCIPGALEFLVVRTIPVVLHGRTPSPAESCRFWPGSSLNRPNRDHCGWAGMSAPIYVPSAICNIPSRQRGSHSCLKAIEPPHEAE